MFIWDFNAICAVAVIVALGIVFSLWMAYTLSRPLEERQRAEASAFRQCQYCGYVYMDHLDHAPCRCPRCYSYHEA